MGCALSLRTETVSENRAHASATDASSIAGLAASGFAVVSLAGFDLFPNTAHVETLAVLQRR